MATSHFYIGLMPLIVEVSALCITVKIIGLAGWILGNKKQAHIIGYDGRQKRITNR